MKEDDLQKLYYESRPARYVNIEGSAELAWGVAMVCFGLNSCIYLMFPHWSWTKWAAWLLLACAGTAPLLLPMVIKKFITWPRTGYLAYRHDKKFWMTIVSSTIIAGALGLLLPFLLKSEIRDAVGRAISSAGSEAKSGAATPSEISVVGLIVLGVFLASNALLYLMMVAATIKQHPWKWILWGVMAAGSLAIPLTARGNFFELMRPLMLFFGLIWSISGAMTLYSYLRKTQSPALEPE
jgi:hypothetical protein